MSDFVSKSKFKNDHQIKFATTEKFRFTIKSILRHEPLN